MWRHSWPCTRVHPQSRYSIKLCHPKHKLNHAVATPSVDMLMPCLMLTVMILSMVPVFLFPMQTLDEVLMRQKQSGFMLPLWRSVREAKWQLERRTGTERRRLRQAWAGRADQEHPVEIGGRRWSDLAVHAASLCAALLARALLSNSKNRQHR